MSIITYSVAMCVQDEIKQDKNTKKKKNSENSLYKYLKIRKRHLSRFTLNISSFREKVCFLFSS